MNLISRRNVLLYGAAASALGFSTETTNGATRIPRCWCGVGGHNKKLIQPYKWGKNHLTYFMLGRDTHDMDSEIWDSQFKLAFESWSEVCPLAFSQVDSQREADFIIGVSRRRKLGFGKSGDILAWAQMPPYLNFDGQLLTVFDLAENWILPEEKRGIILRTVAAHEIGHLLGLYHSEDETALMHPYINDALKPRADDIEKIQLLYGKK